MTFTFVEKRRKGWGPRVDGLDGTAAPVQSPPREVRVGLPLPPPPLRQRVGPGAPPGKVHLVCVVGHSIGKRPPRGSPEDTPTTTHTYRCADVRPDQTRVAFVTCVGTGGPRGTTDASVRLLRATVHTTHTPLLVHTELGEVGSPGPSLYCGTSFGRPSGPKTVDLPTRP